MILQVTCISSGPKREDEVRSLYLTVYLDLKLMDVVTVRGHAPKSPLVTISLNERSGTLPQLSACVLPTNFLEYGHVRSLDLRLEFY